MNLLHKVIIALIICLSIAACGHKKAQESPEGSIILNEETVSAFAKRIENAVLNDNPLMLNQAFDEAAIRDSISNSIVLSSLDTDFGQAFWRDNFKIGNYCVAMVNQGGDFKFIRYYEPLEIIMSVIRRQGRILWTVFSLAAFYIFITALIMFNAEEDINPSTGEYLFHSFFDAIYWSACTLTTVGYGDIYPVSQIGRFISMISAFVGVAIVALPSGIITAGYLDELKAKREQKMVRKNSKKQKQDQIEEPYEEMD